MGSGWQQTFPFLACPEETYWVMELTGLALLLHARLSAPAGETAMLDGEFELMAEMLAACYLQPHQTYLLEHFQRVWVVLDDLRDLPDLAFLMCLEFDEEKCSVAYRTATGMAAAGGLALASHRLSLRAQLERLATRADDLVRNWMALQTSHPVASAPRPQATPPEFNELERELLDALDRLKERGVAKTTGELMANEANRPYDSRLNDALAGLRRRGILGNESGKGYFRTSCGTDLTAVTTDQSVPARFNLPNGSQLRSVDLCMCGPDTGSRDGRSGRGQAG